MNAEEIDAPSVPKTSGANYKNFQIPVYSNDVVAIVNDEIVTMSQLMKEVAPFVPHIRAESRSQVEFQKKIRECQEMVLNAFIERILIVADFKAKGGKIPDNYEQKEYEAHIASKVNGDRLAFAKYLRENGQSVREFKKSIKEHIIVSFVLSEVQKLKTEISPLKIKEYYNAHPQVFLVDRQIFVKGIALDRQKYDDKELASKLVALKQAIESGDKIQTLIEKFSDFPKSPQLEWVSIGEMVPTFANALGGLQVGESTTPFEVDGKIYILFVMDEKPAKKFTLDEARDDIENILTVKYQMEAKKKFIDKLREKAYIKTFL
jgi:peptidyl-prolyl cis-trans isomerase SurA